MRMVGKMMVSLRWASRGVQLRLYHCSWLRRSSGDDDSASTMRIVSDVVERSRSDGEPRMSSWHRDRSSVGWGAPRSRVPHQKPKKSAGSEVARFGQSRLSPELLRLRAEDFAEGHWGSVSQEEPRQEDENTEVLFGVAPCLLALTQGRRTLHRLFVKESSGPDRVSVRQLCEAARRQGVPIRRCRRAELDSMSARRVHQGVCLEASPLDFLTDHGDLAQHRAVQTPLWLVLDSVQDPMNFGAILRSAYFLGVDRVASSIRNSCPLTPVVSKASSGVMEIMGVYGCRDLAGMLKAKVREGWQVVGTVGTEDKGVTVPVLSCTQFQLTSPTLLLMGGEGTGLSAELLELCHSTVTIPAGRELHPAVESLNVSVAAGILLHSLLSSRPKPYP
ncbi:rRNA methyltransferase 1, mitochondrial [Scleropages formosus]|uniref:rRNA methyltransferase 1, mitochondrial n=1 Tax=Scleropages formosus TaxID=113540 RepID=A0A8C9SF90_SCLFO|nr:rRNA methyltransferase 1, mitochondrial [Scleropages formosus]XP_018586534.2 rRNA methyltransferase 1, mitochondrial [Scleropages formosus]XP_018586536.2 rRNA methyltransferase 1, mitochondrial [Scleropages formosus]